MTGMGADVLAAAPLWLVFVGAAAVLLMTVAGGPARPVPQTGTHLVLVALAALAGSAWALLGGEATTAFSGALSLDGLARAFGAVVLGGAALALLLAKGYLREHDLARGEFFALTLLATVGMLIVIMAGDLMVLFIGIEIMSLAAYVLAGYRRGQRRAQEAALKYFVYGAFAAGFVVYGIALIYGATGAVRAAGPTYALSELRPLFAADMIAPLGWVGVAMVLAGLCFKVAAVPFHMWAPDVYEGAPTPSTGLMAVGIKAAAFAGLARLVAATLAAAPPGGVRGIALLQCLALTTIIVGNLLAVRQQQIKRMLAYSSIAHAGYLLVGVAAFAAHPGGRGLAAVVYYLAGYTAMTLGAFGVVAALERRDDRRVSFAIDRLAGAGRRSPALGLAMAAFMFALAGMPPSSGFFGKMALFGAAVEAGHVVTAGVAALAAAAGAVYYLRVVATLFAASPAVEEAHVRSGWLTACVGLCLALTVWLGVQPEPTFGAAVRALTGWVG